MGGKQLGFSDYELTTAKKQTKREKFLAEMEVVVPWKALIDLIAPHYPKASKKGGRPPYPLATMLRIPRFRTGSFFPSLLEPRRRVDRALWAVVMEADVSGVSTRKVDELVAALGCESGISKSELSRICQGLDTQLQAFLNRPLEFSRYPYVYLDATYLHGRDPARKQVIARAVIVAVGITASGQREVLGMEVGDSEDETFWTAFLRRLRERGLGGVQLVISDAHTDLKKAIARCCQGSSWQRCRVHFARNLQAKLPKGSQDMVAAALRSVFAQPEAQAVEQQWDQVAAMLKEQFPAAAALME